MKNPKLLPIPKFGSEEEERKFWEIRGPAEAKK